MCFWIVKIDLFLNFRSVFRKKSSTEISILKGKTLLILLHEFDSLQEESI
ncbi:hypothetical protein LSS_18948 [Leptospira santarosai serovar Shermani str. LT 821]|uniref:Uncharacterized protein n=1 Tax=Leptospira santarosai serovar Shermani str. LT 821 TaxID=758847 RepID=K8Y391_9LEPT|nr:hypothetical protein LSS_18948 [Leptospira santarosai serovar Shermani str. LT 821]